MVMQKPSKFMDIDPILMNFGRYSHLIYINWHAKNEENLPRGFRDRPIATVHGNQIQIEALDEL